MTAEQLNAERMIAALVAEEEREGGSPDEAALVCADAIQESGDDARAEFMRVSTYLGRGGGSLFNDPSTGCVCMSINGDFVTCPLHRRQRELLAANEADWRRAGPCPKCVKGYEKHPSTGEPMEQWCRACDRTGDVGGLLERYTYHPESGNSAPSEPVRIRWVREPVRIRWVRGLPYAVEVPRLSDVLERGEISCRQCYAAASRSHPCEDACRFCGGETWGATNRPTPWAAAVARHHPTVRAFVVGDREPNDEGYGWGWEEGDPINGAEFLPSVLFPPRVVGGMHEGVAAVQPTRDAAIDALARAVMRTVRNLIANPNGAEA